MHSDYTMLYSGLFGGQSSSNSVFGTVKSTTAFAGSFSGGSGSVSAAGFGGFGGQPQPQSPVQQTTKAGKFRILRAICSV